MTKIVTILRGCSGSGKSTYAKFLEGNIEDTTICCADDYFIDTNGEYKFDVTRLGKAHKYCQDRFIECLTNDYTSHIIVSNTSTKEADFKFYLDKAAEYGAQIFSIIIENRHGNKDIHNVPQKTLESQKNNLYNSIKLI